MSGELNLDVLLRSMKATLVDGVFVFATLPDRKVPNGISPVMVFQEAEGTTLILTQDQAEAAKIAYEFPSRMITLNVHSALDAVGFLGHIVPKLAAAGMGVNPVAGFYHDHLFIPLGREADAMAILEDIAASA